MLLSHALWRTTSRTHSVRFSFDHVHLCSKQHFDFLRRKIEASRRLKMALVNYRHPISSWSIFFPHTKKAINLSRWFVCSTWWIGRGPALRSLRNWLAPHAVPLVYHHSTSGGTDHQRWEWLHPSLHLPLSQISDVHFYQHTLYVWTIDLTSSSFLPKSCPISVQF